MTNLRITQLPTPTPLQGTELLECVQSGLNVQTTVSAIAAAVSQYSVVGQPLSKIGGGLGNQLIWFGGMPSIPGGGPVASTPSNIAINQQWQRTGNFGAQALSGTGGNLSGSVQACLMGTGSAANSAADVWPATGTTVTTNPSLIPLARAATNGLPIAGFTMTLYFSFTPVIANAQVFMGFTGTAGGLSGSQVPSALLNSIGLARDTADANLQFMINNGSGSASKTDLGVTLASLANQLLRLVITCDGLGNCTITLSNLEAGGLTYSISYATSTAKLPAASSGAGVNWLAPHLYMNNGGSAANCGYLVMAVFLTAGFGA